MGTITYHDPSNGISHTQHGDVDWPLWLALGAIVVGLLLSLRSRGRAEVMVAGRNMAAAALVAAVLCVLGLMSAFGARDRAIAQQGSGNGPFAGIDRSVAGALRMEAQIGFWITLLALGAAGGMAILVNRGDDGVAIKLRGLTSAGPTLPTEVEDVRFWDRLHDKCDADALEEYLHRFPEGRFADLATTRLVRAGRMPPAKIGETAPAILDQTVTDPAEIEVALVESGHRSNPSLRGAFCSQCGTDVEENAKFCSECGSVAEAPGA